MINQYKNIDNILSAKKPTSAVRFNDIDLDFFKKPQLSIEWRDDLIRSVEPTLPASIEQIASNRKTTSDIKVKPIDNRISKDSVVEMHIYAGETWITGNHRINVKTGKRTSYVDPKTNIRYNLATAPIEIDLYQEFENLNLTRGDFRVVFNFFGNAIGNYEKQTLRIVEISPDRTELRLRSTNQDDSDFLQEISNFIQTANQLATQEEITRLTVNNNTVSIQSPAKYKPLLLNFSRNKTALFVNSVVIGDELFVKLYEPLDSTIQLGNACWVVEEKKPSYIDLVSIIAKQIDSRNNRQRRLSGPNWDANSAYNTSNDTGLRNWNELLGSSVSTSQQLVDKIFSGSLSGIELNIDYSDFNNFVFYSSATERVKNFKYKLELLEYYNSQLATLSSISGSTAIVNIAEFTDKQTALISGFDSFEQYLYYQSGSGYFSNDVPLAQPNVSFITGSYITPYPKSNSTKPYTLEPVTSSIASTWYDALLANADLYDRFNSNALINSVPLFVKADVASESLETFIHMLGHHYDILYTYINYMNRIHSRDEHPKYGVPNELLYSVAKQFGWNLTNGNQSEELWSYLLGTDELGVPQTGSNSVGEASVALSDVTYNTWRRIVNNLPGLLKSKGTKRSVKALLSCYGIPQSMITINEYGGPRIERPPVYEKLNFDYALDLITNTAGTVTVNYDQPINSAELRFRTADVLTNPSLPNTMNLFSVDSNDVTLDFTRGTLGTIQINGTSSADIEMFDGGWLNVLLRSGSEGSLEVVAKKSKYGKIVAAVSASTSGSFAIPTTTPLPIITLGGATFPLFNVAELVVLGDTYTVLSRNSGTNLTINESLYFTNEAYSLNWEASASTDYGSTAVTLEIGSSNLISSTTISGSFSEDDVVYIDAYNIKIANASIDTNAIDVTNFTQLNDASVSGTFVDKDFNVRDNIYVITTITGSDVYFQALNDDQFIDGDAGVTIQLNSVTENIIDYIGTTSVTASFAFGPLPNLFYNNGTLTVTNPTTQTFNITSIGAVDAFSAEFEIDSSYSTSGSGYTEWSIDYINTGSYTSGTISAGDPTLTINGSVTLGGTGGGSRLQGQLQELRLWSSSLGDSAFDNHTKAPAAYDGNVDAYDELIFRLPLTQKIDHSVTSSLTGVEPNLSSISASFDSWTNPIPYDSIEETYYYDGISLATGTSDDNKIRLEDNELIGTLDVKTRAERSQYDKAPLDSKKLGVYFSPQTMINEDIIAQLGFTELDSYIGDPGQTYEKSYPDLIRAAYNYWKKYDTKNDMNAYIKIFSLFDMSFFQQLDQLLPARADKVTGVVIQPNILERNKDSVLPRVNPTSLVQNGLLDINETTVLTGNSLTLLGTINDKIGTITAQDDDQLQGYLTKSSAAKYNGTTYLYDYLYWNGTEYITGSTPYWESVGVIDPISSSRLSIERNNQEVTNYIYPINNTVTTTSSFQSTYSDNPRSLTNPNYLTRDTIIYPLIESSSTDTVVDIDNLAYAKYITLPNSAAAISNVTVSFYELIINKLDMGGNPTASGANIIWGDLYEYVSSSILNNEYPDTATFFNIPISFYGSGSDSGGYYTAYISASFGTINESNTVYTPKLTGSIPAGIEVDDSTQYYSSIQFNTSLTELYDMLTGAGNFTLSGIAAYNVAFELNINFIAEPGNDFDSDIFAIQTIETSGTPLPRTYIVAAITSSGDSIVVSYATGSEYGSAEYQDFTGTGLQNSFYNGCKMSSRAFNVSSTDTIDGGPVVETRETSPNQLIYQAPGDAGSFTLSGRPGRKSSGNGTITSA